MAITKIRGFLIPFATVIFILGISFGLILFGKGYRFDIGNTTIKPTGLVSATSDPIGAQVYVNGVLRTATNNSVNIDPGWHTIRMVKEGYLPWEKQIRLQGEVVARADAFLFPTSPSLSSITTTGVIRPLRSHDGTKIAYMVPFPKLPSDTGAIKNAGIWVYEFADRPLGVNRDPKHIARWENAVDPTSVTMIWAPDGSQLLVSDGLSVRLYQTNRQDDFKIVTASYKEILKEWQDDLETKEQAKLSAFKQEIVDIATTSANIIAFSPDETKMLYEATKSATIPQIITPPLVGTNATKEERTIVPGKLYVYDSREDKNYFIEDAKTVRQKDSKTKQDAPLLLSYDLTILPSLQWFPTSRHLLFMQDGKIDVLEYDRTNWITVYAGPFTDGFMAPWPNSSRIIIMTNLNPGASSFPNLYTINLR